GAAKPHPGGGAVHRGAEGRESGEQARYRDGEARRLGPSAEVEEGCHGPDRLGRQEGSRCAPGLARAAGPRPWVRTYIGVAAVLLVPLAWCWCWWCRWCPSLGSGHHDTTPLHGGVTGLRTPHDTT